VSSSNITNVVYIYPQIEGRGGALSSSSFFVFEKDRYRPGELFRVTENNLPWNFNSLGVCRLRKRRFTVCPVFTIYSSASEPVLRHEFTLLTVEMLHVCYNYKPVSTDATKKDSPSFTFCNWVDVGRRW
jgi:hypothetical protein